MALRAERRTGIDVALEHSLRLRRSPKQETRTPPGRREPTRSDVKLKQQATSRQPADGLAAQLPACARPAEGHVLRSSGWSILTRVMHTP